MESILLSKNFNLRYGKPVKVSYNQYVACLSNHMVGTCTGKLVNGEYYITLMDGRYKGIVEATLNSNP